MFQSTHDREGKSDRTKAREAFFLEFAKAIRDKFPSVPLMVTGGFRTRQGMETAVAEGACDLVGVARPAALNPSLPKNVVFNPEVKDADARLFVKRISPPWYANWIGPSVGAGAESVSCIFFTPSLSQDVKADKFRCVRNGTLHAFTTWARHNYLVSI